MKVNVTLDDELMQRVDNYADQIDVKDHYSFAAVSRKKIKQTLHLIQNEKIKGVKTLIEEAK